MKREIFASTSAEESARERAHRALARRMAAEGMVLRTEQGKELTLVAKLAEGGEGEAKRRRPRHRGGRRRNKGGAGGGMPQSE